MTSTDNAALSRVGTAPRLGAEILSRFRGPGGYYNVGNLIGLCAGLTLQLTNVSPSGRPGDNALVAYFAGSPGTVALTIATLIFVVSGEMYHRAWRGTAPDAGLNRLADLLSAFGSASLAISLIYLGQPTLAVITGLFLVVGKLGSAVFGDNAAAVPFWPADWPDLFRSMVLAGRIPGTAAALLELWHQLGTGSSAHSIMQPAVMVVCHLLWLRADVLLFRSNRATPDLH